VHTALKQSFGSEEQCEENQEVGDDSEPASRKEEFITSYCSTSGNIRVQGSESKKMRLQIDGNNNLIDICFE
jgi:hypothetical protein